MPGFEVQVLCKNEEWYSHALLDELDEATVEAQRLKQTGWYVDVRVLVATEDGSFETLDPANDDAPRKVDDRPSVYVPGQGGQKETEEAFDAVDGDAPDPIDSIDAAEEEDGASEVEPFDFETWFWDLVDELRPVMNLILVAAVGMALFAALKYIF